MGNETASIFIATDKPQLYVFSLSIFDLILLQPKLASLLALLTIIYDSLALINFVAFVYVFFFLLYFLLHLFVVLLLIAASTTRSYLYGVQVGQRRVLPSPTPQIKSFFFVLFFCVDPTKVSRGERNKSTQRRTVILAKKKR